MGLLARALRPSGPTHGRPPCSSRPTIEDVVPMEPDLVSAFQALTVALDGAARLLPAAIFPLPRMKAAPTISSPEACRVVISSSSLAVFG
jgi:hypothetical protein